MPKFPGLVSHNNSLLPVIDTTQKQVKGFGLFSSPSDRDALPSGVQADGFLAVTQVNEKYKAFVYTGNDWDDSASWTELGVSPGGNKHAVLSKLSDLDNDYDWTEQPQFESVAITKYSSISAPSINLYRSRGSDTAALETASGDIIAQIGFSGASIGGGVATAGKMVFTQVSAAGYGDGVATKLELFVGTDAGDVSAFTINEERVVSVSRQSAVPDAVAGGIYADSSNRLFFGIDN